MSKKRLSVFIDESGDLGEYNTITEFYIVSFVFHDQSNNINGQIERLDNSLKMYSMETFAIHTEPLIRREEIYKDMKPHERRDIFSKLFFFSLSINIQYKTFVFSKKHFKNTDSLLAHINRGIFDYLVSKKSFFDKYDEVIIYYDNGQLPIKNTIQTMFSLLFDNIEMRRVVPADYKLFQTADMMCTMYLMNAKYDNHPMSHSEKWIFNSKYDFYHDFFNPMSKKELK